VLHLAEESGVEDCFGGCGSCGEFGWFGRKGCIDIYRSKVFGFFGGDPELANFCEGEDGAMALDELVHPAEEFGMLCVRGTYIWCYF
jgi:hypothetical protein